MQDKEIFSCCGAYTTLNLITFDYLNIVLVVMYISLEVYPTLTKMWIEHFGKSFPCQSQYSSNYGWL